MEFTQLSLIGAFIMLVIGVVDYALLKKLMYAQMRDRHEQAKVTGSHGANPATFWTMLKIVSFLALPAVGFFFGDAVLSPFFSM